MRNGGVVGKVANVGNLSRTVANEVYLSLNVLFSCKKRISVSSQYWLNNRRFFYSREHALNFLLFTLSVSIFYLRTDDLEWELFIEGVFHILRFFGSGRITY
jgi:hypothetical protein